MRGYLSEAVKMVPFYTDTLSEGRVCLFHLAMVESSVSILMGSLPGEVYILLALKYF